MNNHIHSPLLSHTGIAAASGMAATTQICQLLKTGDHIVAMNDLYGGQLALLTTVANNSRKAEEGQKVTN